MPRYIEPSQSAFENAEAALSDAMTTKWPALLTKAGSVIRELVVRPTAYLYSWLADNMAEARRKSTMSYLMESNLTENPVADAVASNYFVTRREGIRSKGVVTLIINSAAFQIPAGSIFTCEGVSLMTETTVIAIDTTYRTADGVQYVPILPYDSEQGLYVVNVPVVALEAGPVELAPGSEVQAMFGGATTVQAYLTSAVTGGSGTETDAELMERAKYNTAESGIGSYYGLKKKLSRAPVPVLSFNVIAGEDTELTRARWNTVNINPGGYIDVYVRTQIQAETAIVKGDIEALGGNTYRIVLGAGGDYAGAYGVSRVIAEGVEITDYTVEYSAVEHTTDARSARLSSNQTIIITFTTDTALAENPEDDDLTMTATVMLSYIAGIDQLQRYMDTDNNRFIGQDVYVKAAVPIALTLSCALRYDGDLTEEIANDIKQVIANRVNAYPVGTEYVNFSDIRDAVAATDPKASLRLPCAYSMLVPLRNGSVVCYSSTTGLAGINAPVAEFNWPSQVCFFSLVPGNIRLERA